MTDQTHLDLPALTRAASDIFSVQRVFGEPYERGGTLVVPVAKLVGSHGVAGAHADARLGIRKGVPGGTGTDAHGPGTEPEGADAPPPADAAGASGPWHRGPAGRGPGGRGPQWPFGTGRPAGRSGGHADSGGYAGRVKPLGVYVVTEDGARWQPALDLNRVILGGQALGAVTVLALAWALRRRR
jgi:uncharacterized spore protein YtfJ